MEKLKQMSLKDVKEKFEKSNVEKLPIEIWKDELVPESKREERIWKYKSGEEIPISKMSTEEIKQKMYSIRNRFQKYDKKLNQFMKSIEELRATAASKEAKTEVIYDTLKKLLEVNKWLEDELLERADHKK